MITHVAFGLDFIQIAFGKAAAANHHDMLQVKAPCAQAPERLAQKEALQRKEKKAEQEEDDQHLARIVVHMPQRQEA